MITPETLKQWDVVYWLNKYDPTKHWNGLVIDAESKRILWDNGHISIGYGPGFFDNTTKIDSIFDVEKAWTAAIPMRTIYLTALDNLAYIEILAGYREHLRKNGQVV